MTPWLSPFEATPDRTGDGPARQSRITIVQLVACTPNYRITCARPRHRVAVLDARVPACKPGRARSTHTTCATVRTRRREALQRAPPATLGFEPPCKGASLEEAPCTRHCIRSLDAEVARDRAGGWPRRRAVAVPGQIAGARDARAHRCRLARPRRRSPVGIRAPRSRGQRLPVAHDPRAPGARALPSAPRRSRPPRDHGRARADPGRRRARRHRSGAPRPARIPRQPLDGLGPLVGRDLAVERFRPNILVDAAGGTAYPEDAWVGATIQIGAPRLRVDQRHQR